MLLVSLLTLKNNSNKIFRCLHSSSLKLSGHDLEYWWGPEKNNGREVVGFGMTGDEVILFKLIKIIFFF